MSDTPVPAPVPDSTPRTLETETCSRCGGSGSYSWCQMHGSVCFKCGGRKVVFTKRGAAANTYLRNLRSKPARDLQVGEVVRLPSITMGGSPCDIWMTITEITIIPAGPLPEGMSGPVNGYTQEVVYIDAVTRSGQQGGYSGMPSGDLVRVAQTAQQKADTLVQALAYQATLTKLGKPRATKSKKNS